MIMPFFKKKYKIDFCGQKDWYTNTRESYKPGERVKLYYPHIATDTNYTFILDGECINHGYDEKKGFVISFTMPEKDVKLECVSKNTMIIDTELNPVEKEVVLIDYYRATVATVGGDGYKESVLYDRGGDSLLLRCYSKSFGSDETVVEYLVPRDALEECQKIIKKNKLNEWKDRDDLVAITGARVAVRFINDDGSRIRVSSEAMPENGKELMYEVGAALGRYARDEYRLS